MPPSTAEIATEVDRLVIGVHRLVTARHRAWFGDLVDSVGIDSPGHLYDLAEFIAVGACTAEVARHRFRYQPDDTAGAMVSRLQRRHLLDGRLRPAGGLVDVIETILVARAVAAADLWGSELAGALRGTAEALSHASGTLVNVFRSLPEPTPAAHRLHHMLTGLRYARLDAHISAWEEAGLTAAEIVALSAADMSKPVSPVSHGLVARGWLTTQGTATVEGRTARSAIEMETNVRCDRIFDAVTNRDGWFATLRSLPAVD